MEKEIIKKIRDIDMFDLNYTNISMIDHKLKKRDINIVYGETYDRFGMTVDSLKYYFLLGYLHKILQSNGYKTTSTIIVGDIASIRNKNVPDKDEFVDITNERIIFMQKLFHKYNLPLEIKKMSDIFKAQEFKETFNKVSSFDLDNPEIEALLQSTILKNRLKQEKENNFLYTIEEVSLILSYDIKIGPPREIFYDKIAKIIGSALNINYPAGLYTKPTYPLGLNYDYFINHPEVETYGLTPYKAGSNRLMNNRIIINKSNKSDILKLLQTSFIPNYPELPNPVYDLYQISSLIGNTSPNVSLLNTDSNKLRKEALRSVSKYIIDDIYGI